jgi:peptide/nickel transport system substrate-binding protein
MEMKNKVICVMLSLMIALSLVLASCAKPAPTTTPPTTPPTKPPPTVEAKWWDKLGEPQYGGTLTYRVAMHTPVFDPGVPAPGAFFMQYEDLVSFDWTVDRQIWPFNTNFAPIKYYMGVLAESWEMTDPLTLTMHLRQGVHWQNIPPVNGREFTSDDVVQHYDRIMGTGSGYTTPSFFAGWLSLLEKVTAIDKYTIAVKFKAPNVLALFQFFDQANESQIEPPEVAKLSAAAAGPPGPPGPGGPPMAGGVDWKNAAGTGPWMLTDFVQGTSITFDKNPDYWGYDERHPQNKLPYVDTLNVLIIPDTATALAALRTGKIDLMNAIDWQQAASLAKTNPELQQIAIPAGGAAIDYRVDKPPFTDIRVRKALEMAIDRKAIAQSYYGGTVDGTPAGLISTQFPGYYFAYEDWPQALKDEYAFNPTRAKELLEEAGYPTGFKTNVVAATNADLQLLQLIQSCFMDIGVDMEINAMDFTTFRSYVVAKKHDQMAYSSMHQTATTRPPHNTIYARYSKEKELNLTMNNDPGYDAIVQKFETAVDEAAYAQATQEADRYAIEKHWALYTFPIVTYNIWQPWLKGYSGEEATGGGGVGYAVVWARLWIDQAMKQSMGR